MIYSINRNFGVGKRKHVPHITLVGPLKTRNEKKLISDFAKICSHTKLMRFKGKGFGTFDNNRVVYVHIGASEKLNDLRNNLVSALRPYCSLQPHDKKQDADRFKFHSTLAMKLNQDEFQLIKNYINKKPAPNFTQIVMRISLLKNGRILREYDFLQRKLLNRKQALNRNITRRSKTLLKKFMKNDFDPNNEIIEHKIINESLFRRIISFFTGK
jgi:2'-5' RNA ligase